MKYKRSPETRAKLCASWTPERRAAQSAKWTPARRDAFRKKMHEASYDPETGARRRSWREAASAAQHRKFMARFEETHNLPPGALTEEDMQAYRRLKNKLRGAGAAVMAGELIAKDIRARLSKVLTADKAGDKPTLAD